MPEEKDWVLVDREGLVHQAQSLGIESRGGTWIQTNAERQNAALTELRKFRNELIGSSNHAYAERLQIIIHGLDPESSCPPMLRVGAKGSWQWYRDLPGPVHFVKSTTVLCKDEPIGDQTDDDGYWLLKWTDCIDLATCAKCISEVRKSVRGHKSKS